MDLLKNNIIQCDRGIFIETARRKRYPDDTELKPA